MKLYTIAFGVLPRPLITDLKKYGYFNKMKSFPYIF